MPHTQATQTSLVVCLFHRMPVVHKNQILCRSHQMIPHEMFYLQDLTHRQNIHWKTHCENVLPLVYVPLMIRIKHLFHLFQYKMDIHTYNQAPGQFLSVQYFPDIPSFQDPYSYTKSILPAHRCFHHLKASSMLLLFQRQMGL